MQDRSQDAGLGAHQPGSPQLCPQPLSSLSAPVGVGCPVFTFFPTLAPPSCCSPLLKQLLPSILCLFHSTHLWGDICHLRPYLWIHSLQYGYLSNYKSLLMKGVARKLVSLDFSAKYCVWRVHMRIGFEGLPHEGNHKGVAETLGSRAYRPSGFQCRGP